jgi:hydroxyacylglutathione hydrolase
MLMYMQSQTFSVGMFLANCYVVSCSETQEAIIIDPGFDQPYEAKRIFDFVEAKKLDLKLVVNTHGHPDHTCGNGTVKDRFGTPIMIHGNDAYMIGEAGRKISEFFGLRSHSPPADILLKDGDSIKFGNVTLQVLSTPGHSRGSISLLGKTEIYTGDTLFAGSIGRTDFPESSEQEMLLSLRKLKELPDSLAVYPGHGPATTLKQEKLSNPFLQ